MVMAKIKFKKRKKEGKEGRKVGGKEGRKERK